MARILLVDGDERSRMVYGRLLESEGYGVRAAADASDALQAFDTEPFDLVVLETRLPGMDGLETMQRMLYKDSSIPIVLNTTDASRKDCFLSWVADAFIVKSADAGELLATIRTLLATHASSHERLGTVFHRLEPPAPLPSVAARHHGGAP